MMMRVSLLRHMELSGIKIVNSPQAFSSARNKYMSYCILAKNGLQVPSTYITGRAVWARSQTSTFNDFVYKPMIGSKGHGLIRFNDSDIAYNAFHLFERLGQPILIQEWLSGSGSDIRAFVVKGEVIAAMRRTPKEGEWRANLAQGAKAERIDLNRELSSVAVRSVSALGLEYAGVDLLETDQGPVVLEVNASPSWQGIQETTSTDIPSLLVEKMIASLQ
jgi:ribosomal protein S6--L-glutamate ligase